MRAILFEHSPCCGGSRTRHPADAGNGGDGRPGEREERPAVRQNPKTQRVSQKRSEPSGTPLRDRRRLCWSRHQPWTVVCGCAGWLPRGRSPWAMQQSLSALRETWCPACEHASAAALRGLVTYSISGSKEKISEVVYPSRPCVQMRGMRPTRGETGKRGLDLATRISLPGVVDFVRPPTLLMPARPPACCRAAPAAPPPPPHPSRHRLQGIINNGAAAAAAAAAAAVGGSTRTHKLGGELGEDLRIGLERRPVELISHVDALRFDGSVLWLSVAAAVLLCVALLGWRAPSAFGGGTPRCMGATASEDLS